MRALAAAALVLGAGAALTCSDGGKEERATPPRALRVLFFQEEGADVGWYHSSNPVAERALRTYGEPRGWQVTTAKTSDGVFTPTSLARFDVVVYLLSSGTVLDASERAAFQGYIERGGGYAGVHSASFTDPDWDFYVELVGARFAREDRLAACDVTVEKPAEPLLAGLPPRWSRTDQWYAFLTRPEENPNLEILLAVDESTFPADYPDHVRTGYHPIAWRQTRAGARSFYTAMGHTDESYQEEPFLAFVARGIEWAGELARKRTP